jgi:hypothetical protein
MASKPYNHMCTPNCSISLWTHLKKAAPGPCQRSLLWLFVTVDIFGTSLVLGRVMVLLREQRLTLRLPEPRRRQFLMRGSLWHPVRQDTGHCHLSWACLTMEGGVVKTLSAARTLRPFLVTYREKLRPKALGRLSGLPSSSPTQQPGDPVLLVSWQDPGAHKVYLSMRWLKHSTAQSVFPGQT